MDASSAALPPAAVVLTVMVCSAQSQAVAQRVDLRMTAIGSPLQRTMDR